MIVTVLFSAALAAQPSTAPPPKVATQSVPKTHEKKADKNAAPDPDLIEFLGDYEDAADGLDPIGLSEQMSDDKTTVTDEKKKDGHGS